MRRNSSNRIISQLITQEDPRASSANSQEASILVSESPLLASPNLSRQEPAIFSESPIPESRPPTPSDHASDSDDSPGIPPWQPIRSNSPYNRSSSLFRSESRSPSPVMQVPKRKHLADLRFPELGSSPEEKHIVPSIIQKSP